MAEFLDWIPDGAETGGITANGFQDFVPEKTPKLQVIPKETPVLPTAEDIADALTAPEEVIDPELDIEPEEVPSPKVEKNTKKK